MSLINSSLLPVYDQPNPVFVKGEGMWLEDAEGRRYLDFASGVAVNIFGHCHPRLMWALGEQGQTLWHTSNWWKNQAALDLSKALTERSFADRVFLCNSGAEANEAALKLARKFSFDQKRTGKHTIVACHGGFHGRTLLTVSASGKYHEPFAPLPGGIVHVPFNDCSALKKAVDKNCCAVILELVQGEGGVRGVNADFLQAARELCDRHQALLIFDEIQTGLGRTGRLFAYQHFDVEPDVMTLAKALGGGFPIGAMLTREQYAWVLEPGWHGSTFGGNPLGARVAREVLSMIDEPLLEHVNLMGQKLRARIQSMNHIKPFFSNLRQYGLLLGIDLLPQYSGPEVQRTCMREGLLVLLADGGKVLRLAPSLLMGEDEITLVATRLRGALDCLWIG